MNVREKFRIRCYNKDLTLIHLEKKWKANGLGAKEKARLTLDYGLRTGLHCTDFLDPDCLTIPADGPLPFPNTPPAGCMIESEDIPQGSL